jgi:uncharacterized protein YjbI with pentapeptide repeats/beta-lactamase regulating signal transducer with metallopeptidase domain
MADWGQTFITFASAISAIALNALWQDALLVLCVWALLRAWPGINASTRYVVWNAALVAALVVPVATTLAFFTVAKPAISAHASISTARTTQSAAVPTLKQTRAKTSQPVASPPQTPQVSRLPERMRLTVPVPLALAIFAIWLALAAYALVRLTIGLFRLEQLKRDALPLPVEYRDAMPQWLRANKGARDVRLCISDETDVPVAVGLFDAMILIPHSLLERLSEPEVDQICLHELAHLRRADDWTNGLQRVVSALLGWNPAAQFIGQQLDLEREVACDDWVLSFVKMVRPYALCLTKMAESASWPRHAIPAPGVFSTRKHISLRIERLLGAGRNMATNLALAPAAAAVAIVAALALVIALVAPSVAAPCLTTIGPIAINLPATRVSVPATHVFVPATRVNVPATHVNVPAVRVNVPATHASIPATHVSIPATHVEVPATHVDVPATHVNVPATHVEVPGMHFTVPGQRVDVPKMHFDVPSYGAIGASTVAQASSCVNCNYSGVNWAGRDLHGVSYNGVDFSKANLTGVNFSGGSFVGADFSGANLGGASFRNAHLTGCDFTNANLSGVDFTGARMSGCDFTRAKLGSSQLRDVVSGCKGCDFTHADLAGLDLRGIRTNGDDFSGADLRNANLAGAVLVGTDFSNAKFDGANLAGATFNGCDLSGVDLTHVDLSRTKMIGMDFSKDHPPHR